MSFQISCPNYKFPFITIEYFCININIPMQQEPQTMAQNPLPYEPIKFVYTQTIGSVLQKFKEIIDPYTWTYQDILQPKILTNSSKVEYYLFHIAPIYNWLRKVDSNILSNYLILGQKGGNPASVNTPIFGVSKTPQYKKFDQTSFLTQIKHYLQQWQIVKLCTCAKVKVITTKTDELMKQGSKFHNHQNKNHKQPQMRCTHIIKKQKFTSEYTLNDFTPSNIKLQCTRVFCDECQQYVKVKCQITKYPFAPYFLKYRGKQFLLNDNSSNKLTYQLAIVYGQENVYVKTSGGVWYQIAKQKTSVISFDKIQLKTGHVFVYQQSLNSNKVLRKAQPLILKLNTQLKIQQLSHNHNEDSDSQNLYPSNKPKPNFDKLKAKSTNSHKNTAYSEKNNLKPQQKENDQQDQVLQDMCKNPLPVILNKKTTDRKVFKQYKKTVEGLLPKQREKDQYEKNYDKGKTKKIHKNRQQFRTADFFKLYNQIKHKNPNQPSSGNNMQEKEHFIQKQKTDKNSGTYRQKDEQYNEVCQDRRGQRRSRGHFGNKFGNKNGNKDGSKFGSKFGNKFGSKNGSKFGNKFNKNGQNRGKGESKFGKAGQGNKFRRQ